RGVPDMVVYRQKSRNRRKVILWEIDHQNQFRNRQSKKTTRMQLLTKRSSKLQQRSKTRKSKRQNKALRLCVPLAPLPQLPTAEKPHGRLLLTEDGFRWPSVLSRRKSISSLHWVNTP